MTVPTLTLRGHTPTQPQPESYEPRWQDDRACRNVPTAVFFPERGDVAALRTALDLCNSCPVQSQCREEHLYEPAGVFGGMSERERRTYRMRRNGRRSPGRHQPDGATAKILRYLASIDGTWIGTGQDLCAATGLEGNTKSVTTDMRRRGLVETTVENKRITSVTITAEGLALVGL